MNEIKSNWESLGISNDFLFGKIMGNPELCIELLERILPDMKIEHIEYPELQKTIKEDVSARGVRLDVYIKDKEGSVYDIEMQMTNTKELPKRSRYYQGMIDLQLIDKSVTYKNLNKSYVIFICPFDLFGKSRHIYTFENICREDSSIRLGDDAVKIFLNSDSEMDDVSVELKAFLDYVAGRKSEDIFVKKLEKALKKAKINREWRHEYMTLLMRDRENWEKGMEQGMEKGMEKGLEQGKSLMVENALKTTRSIKQTALILCLTEQEVREIAQEKEIEVDD